MAIGFLFAPIDVNIVTHDKAIAAGTEAMGLWLYGRAWAEVHSPDEGIIPERVALGAWHASHNASLVERLCAAGLWIKLDSGGYQIHNFSKKRPKRASSKERTKRYREKKKSVTGASHQTSHGASHTKRVVTSPSISISTSISSSEGESERESGEMLVEPEAKDRPSTVRYREAYCRGITTGKGSPYIWPGGEWADGDLAQIITAHSAKRRGHVLDAFIESTAKAFAEAAIASGDDLKYWSHLAPKGCKNWLNANGFIPKPRVPDATPILRERDEWERTAATPEEQAANAEQLQRLLSGVGR